MRIFTLLGLLFLAPLAPAQSNDTSIMILFILDGSGSMWGKIKDQPKIEIAKDTMINLVRKLPNEISAGLEVYGHRRADDCNDIELLSAPGKSDKATLIKQIQSIIPRGQTPITESLKRAAEHLKDSGERTTIVLISDGKDNCTGNPCVFIEELKTRGSKIRTHVIGLAIDKTEQEQLLCITTAGGGRYFDVQNASQLAQALVQIQQAVLQKMQADSPLLAASKPVISITDSAMSATGTLEIRNFRNGDVYIFDQDTDREQGFYCDGCANNIRLPVGRYKLEFTSFVAEGIEIKSGERTLFDLNHITGTLEIRNYYGDDVYIHSQSAETSHSSEVYLLDQQTGEQRATYCNDCSDKMQLPGGRYKLEFPDFIIEGVEVKPGENTVFDLTTLERNKSQQ